MIKAALFRVEQGYERNMHGTTPTGSIFVLKNMGWKDKQDHELSGGLEISRVELPAKAPIGAPVDL
jgi:hypothetical protein